MCFLKVVEMYAFDGVCINTILSASDMGYLTLVGFVNIMGEDVAPNNHQPMIFWYGAGAVSILMYRYQYICTTVLSL